LKGHEAELAVFEGRHRRFGDAKLAVIAVGIVAAWFVVARQAMDAEWLWIVVAVYVALAVAHELTLRKRRAAESAVALYRRGIARIEDSGQGAGRRAKSFARGSCLRGRPGFIRARMFV